MRRPPALRRSRRLAVVLLALTTALACDDGAEKDGDPPGASDAEPPTPQVECPPAPDRGPLPECPPPDGGPADPTPELIPEGQTAEAAAAVLDAHCEEAIGPARVEEVAPGLYVAIGYDLANTILLQTPAGNVIIDAGMSPARSEVTRAALDEVAPGPVAAIIYTHGHIDHIGGATIWAEADTPIWGTAPLSGNVVASYGAFSEAETARGSRQFGRDVELDFMPCSALGRRVDVDAARSTGTLLPTDTFEDQVTLDFDGISVELHAAPGETTDQLFVYVPHLDALMPGDNYYLTFPNLYTIRGTKPRPVDGWIDSLDAMRRIDPELLIPSHTVPVEGRAEIRAALQAYRDGIAWVRDQVVRGANAGLDVDTIAASAALPPHLAEARPLLELYGQVDWSARAIYSNRLGWFDGRTTTLYPPAEPLRREVDLMGGSARVLAVARQALDGDDPRWAGHLLDKLRRAGIDDPQIDAMRAEAWAALAARVPNSNGRGWLATRSAALATGEVRPEAELELNERLLDRLPMEAVFVVMPARLNLVAAGDRHEAIRIDTRDAEPRVFTLVLRRGVLEVTEGEPLPGTPAPSATLQIDTPTFVRLALGQLPAAEALAEGLLEVDDLGAALGFLALFQQ